MKLSLGSETLIRGSVVQRPPGTGEGFWVGAPCVYREESSGKFYLSYRLRRPRGGDPALERGGESRIAVSTDGISFRDVWSVRKTQYRSSSIEKSAIYRDPGGRWRYFTSFVNPLDGRWCVARYDADEIEKLDPASAEVLFDARELGLEGVKDPWIYHENGVYRMYLSVALPTPETNEGSHATRDIYNTGQCLSATGLALSRDLAQWEWQGVVLAPDTGWDGYCRRLNAIVALDGEYLGFYDGALSHLENYEEKTGIARSRDLTSWSVESRDGPALQSPYGRNALRYMSVCEVGERTLLYYELAVEDGSHELRMVALDKQELLS